jgi:ATP synthase protein I
MDRRRAKLWWSSARGHWPVANVFAAAEFNYQGFPHLANNAPDDDALARRIAAARASESSQRDGKKREESQGWSIAVEFVGAMLVGGLIGWFIDRQAGSGPWGLIVMLLLGFVTGLRSVLRQQKKFDGK